MSMSRGRSPAVKPLQTLPEDKLAAAQRNTSPDSEFTAYTAFRSDVPLADPMVNYHKPPTPAPPPLHRTFGYSGPLGLCCTATTLLIDSFVVSGASGIHVPASIVSVAFGYGGICQILAGMWEFASGNTFGATVYTSYGGFWISYGIMLSPLSGIEAAFASEYDYGRAIGLFYFAWMITTIVFLIAAHRSSIVLVALFTCLTLCFLFLGVAKWYPAIAALNNAGAAFGFVTSALSWYLALGSLLPPDSLIKLPVGELS